MKEWEEIHEQKVGELESLISSLIKNISKQDGKLRSKRLERIYESWNLKKKGEENKLIVQKVVRVKVRVPKETRVRVEGKIHLSHPGFDPVCMMYIL